MPVPHSRRARLVLLAFALIVAFAAGAAQAKTPFSIHKVYEGDPGDGVLRPSIERQPPLAGPIADETSSGTAVAVDVQDYAVSSAAASRPMFRLPVSLYVPGLGWAVITPLWLLNQGGWTHAP